MDNGGDIYMEFITSWAQGIIVSVIIATIIEMLLPNNGNGKYVKVVVGIFILFSIVSPIITKFKGKSRSLIDLDTYIKENDKDNTIQASNLNVNNNETIKTTPSHPFLTTKGWIQASELSEDDLLMTSNNAYQPIESIEVIKSSIPIDIYNLCVDDYHTFLVGENQFVVHNRCNPNEKYAGQTRHIDDDPKLAKKYPDGVFIKETGYPDFSPYKYNKGGFKGEVSFELQKGCDSLLTINN